MYTYIYSIKTNISIQYYYMLPWHQDPYTYTCTCNMILLRRKNFFYQFMQSETTLYVNCTCKCI